jgi:hypothetical protein
LRSWVDAAFQALAIDEERSSFGPTPWTSDPRADQHVEQVWFAGVHSDVGGGYPTLRCCGWPTGRVSVDSSSKRMRSQRRLRMPPRRHKTGWSCVDPNPLGTLRQARTAWGLQLTPGPVTAGFRYGGRPGSDPAGNPPLSRCIGSPIRCSVWMRRKQAASSGSIRSAANDSGIRNPLQRDGSTSPRPCDLKLVLEE